MLAAAREHPEAILVCTDGYENVRQGDTAAVVEGLRQLGLSLPIFQVVPLFAAGEDLTRRRLSEACERLLANTIVENYAIEIV